MDIDVATNFLIGSVLFGSGFIIFCIVVLVINNLFHRFWKKFELFTMPNVSQPIEFVTQEEIDMIQKKRKSINETKIS